MLNSFNKVMITYNYVNDVILKADKKLGVRGKSGYFTEEFQKTGTSFQYWVLGACASP